MKTGFKDALKVKEGKNVKSPWNYECPPYDERSSCFVNAGTNYGVGHKTPVGSTKHNSKYAVPVGHPHDMKVDHVYKGKPSLIHSEENE